ncbi:MAG: hypothetical protein K6G88_03875 [Lachnospiraceae bacterium]|nr:hypothetical protein [Lachnospiraceae bacterium]
MKKKKKTVKEVFVCERCGNPVSPYAIKCKWCKKTLRPEYYKEDIAQKDNKNGEE